MSQTDPLPPKPPIAAVHEVAGPFWKRPGVIANIISTITGLPSLVSLLNAIPGFHLPHQAEVGMLLVAAVTLYVSRFFSAAESGDAAARASRMGPGA